MLAVRLIWRVLACFVVKALHCFAAGAAGATPDEPVGQPAQMRHSVV
jgi:hypothetical protein